MPIHGLHKVSSGCIASVLGVWLIAFTISIAPSSRVHGQIGGESPGPRVAGREAAAATAPPPAFKLSRIFDRSAIIMSSLAVASAATAVGILVTDHPSDSFIEGVGQAHAFWAAGYALDAGLRLYVSARAHRAERAGRYYRPAGTGQWVAWMNLGTTGTLFVGSTLFAALVRDDNDARGFATTFAVHSVWLFAWSIRQVINVRHHRIPWMAMGPTGIQF